MLECVDLQRVAEVCENRKKYGYRFVSEWISKDFFLIPDKTIITVDVKGKFGIPKECSAKHPKLSFIPVAQDNFTRFLVELKTSGTVYGVLSIRDNKSVLDEIFYDPASTKKLPSNKKIRDELLGNRNDHLVISRSSTTGNRIGKDTADNSVADKKDGIFLFVHSHIHNNKKFTLQKADYVFTLRQASVLLSFLVFIRVADIFLTFKFLKVCIIRTKPEIAKGLYKQTV